MRSCFDRSNAAKEGVAPEAAALRPRRAGLVLRVIVAEERLQKHVVGGSTICAEEFCNNSLRIKDECLISTSAKICSM